MVFMCAILKNGIVRCLAASRQKGFCKTRGNCLCVGLSLESGEICYAEGAPYGEAVPTITGKNSALYP